MLGYDFLKTEYLEKRKSISMIAHDLDCSDSKVYYYLNKYGLDCKGTRSNHVMDESRFSFENPLFCYFMGLSLTDGHLDYKNQRVTVSVKNPGAERVFNALLADFKSSVKVARYGVNHDKVTMCIHSKALLEKFAEAGISGHKIQRSFNHSLDTELSAKCFRMFLRGIFDGDGSIHKTGGTVRMACSSMGLMSNLVYYANRYLHDDYHVIMGSNQRKKSAYPGIHLHKKDSEAFLTWLYIGFPDIRFDDKYARYALHYR